MVESAQRREQATHSPEAVILASDDVYVGSLPGGGGAFRVSPRDRRCESGRFLGTRLVSSGARATLAAGWCYVLCSVDNRCRARYHTDGRRPLQSMSPARGVCGLRGGWVGRSRLEALQSKGTPCLPPRDFGCADITESPSRPIHYSTTQYSGRSIGLVGGLGGESGSVDAATVSPRPSALVTAVDVALSNRPAAVHSGSLLYTVLVLSRWHSSCPESGHSSFLDDSNSSAKVS